MIRHLSPHDELKRLAIFPILLGETSPETLPAFLRLFQATRWNGTDALPPRLLAQIRERNIVRSEAARFEGCPFVGLAAFQVDQAQLFFGREKEVLDCLAQGFLYKEIADKLGISYETVHTYIRRIYEKLQVRTRTEAVAKFLRR